MKRFRLKSFSDQPDSSSDQQPGSKLNLKSSAGSFQFIQNDKAKRFLHSSLVLQISELYTSRMTSDGSILETLKAP